MSVFDRISVDTLANRGGENHSHFICKDTPTTFPRLRESFLLCDQMIEPVGIKLKETWACKFNALTHSCR